MPRFSNEILRPLWERAMEAEIGISVQTSDPQALRLQLLEARKQIGGFEDIMTFCPEGKDEVFMVKKSAELPDA